MEKYYLKTQTIMKIMKSYDYKSDLKAVEKRIEWLKEARIAAQQHSCPDVEKVVEINLENAEKELEDLHALR